MSELVLEPSSAFLKVSIAIFLGSIMGRIKYIQSSIYNGAYKGTNIANCCHTMRKERLFVLFFV